MVVVWPYLWADPDRAVPARTCSFVSPAQVATTRPESFAPVMQAITLTTPPVFLGLALFAVLPSSP